MKFKALFENSEVVEIEPISLMDPWRETAIMGMIRVYEERKLASATFEITNGTITKHIKCQISFDTTEL